MTIRINLSLPSGWSTDRAMTWFSSHMDRKISEWKNFEWQTDYFGWTTLFDLQLDLIPTGCDHASLGFSLTIFGFMVDAKIYDSRHWDYDKNTWKKYDQISNEERERDYAAEALSRAYKLVEEDLAAKAHAEHQAYLQTPEGQAELAAELERRREEKRKRGEAQRAANIARAKELDWSKFPSSMPLPPEEKK